jgi:hypothetical protein
MRSAKHICLWNKRLNRDEINRAAGSIIKGVTPSNPTPVVALPNDKQDPSCDYRVDCVYESEIPFLEIPKKGNIVKMTKKHWVDEFFKDGSIKLGSIAEFQAYEHPEIGDPSEGVSVAVSNYTNSTFAFEIDHPDGTIFCTYAGEPDLACIERFGYDSCFEIFDPSGFARAIAVTIGAEKYGYSSCVYREKKVVVRENPHPIDFSGVGSEDFMRLAGHARSFVKPERYSHQCEFRFMWLNPKRPSQYIKCLEATKYCRRIDCK